MLAGEAFGEAAERGGQPELIDDGGAQFVGESADLFDGSGESFDGGPSFPFPAGVAQQKLEVELDGGEGGRDAVVEFGGEALALGFLRGQQLPGQSLHLGNGVVEAHDEGGGERGHQAGQADVQQQAERQRDVDPFRNDAVGQGEGGKPADAAGHERQAGRLPPDAGRPDEPQQQAAAGGDQDQPKRFEAPGKGQAPAHEIGAGQNGARGGADPEPAVGTGAGRDQAAEQENRRGQQQE